MNTITGDLNEFICLPERNVVENFFNNREKILALLDFYKKYRAKLGTFEVKSMKKLWQVVARDLSNMFKVSILPSKCENKMKALERKYKNIVDNNNKTGRGSKIFEFEKEFYELYNKKNNIQPTILLTSEEVRKPIQIYENIAKEHVEGSASEIFVSIPEISEENGKSPNLLLQKKIKRLNRPPTYKKRNDILLEIKNDLKSYYASKLDLEKEKLELKRKKMCDAEKRTAVLEKQVEILEKLQGGTNGK